METLKIKNPKPQGDWILLEDFLVGKGWNRVTQKLLIQLNDKYKIAQLVKLQNEIVNLVKNCNEIFGIEIQYEDITIHETLTTIPQGVLKPIIADEIETTSDKRHLRTLQSEVPFLLKIN